MRLLFLLVALMAITDDIAIQAADKVATILSDAKVAGEFDDVLAVIDATYTEANMSVAKRYLPLSELQSLGDGVYVSVMPGVDGEEEYGEFSTRLKKRQTFNVQVAVERLVSDEAAATVEPLLKLSQQVSEKLRGIRLTGLDSTWSRTVIVARYSPLSLLDDSVFLSLRKFEFKGPT